jgi:hypothetical protein
MDNAPSFDQAALQIDDADADPNSLSNTTAADQQALSGDPCHPHLFSRTHYMVGRLNRHTNKLLHRVARLIGGNPRSKDGFRHSWERIDDGVDHKFTMTRTDTGFSFELDLAPKGTGNFVKVFWGAANTVTTGNVTERTGSFDFDYTALHSVIPAEKATGQLEMDFDIVRDPSKPAPGVKKTMVIKVVNFLPEEGDSRGPRNASYLHLGEPGLGGLLQYQDSLVLQCPANPQGKVSDVTTHARWFKGSDHKIHGRADSKASGGPIPDGDTWIGVSCHNGFTTRASLESAYWMMKLEDATGATVQGSARESTDGATNPCDAAFGPVPALANNATDYAFNVPLTFPNEW